MDGALAVIGFVAGYFYGRISGIRWANRALKAIIEEAGKEEREK